MKKNIFNKVIFGVLLTIVTCFSCLNSVSAFYDFDMEIGTDVNSHCNTGNSCYPICIYGNNNDGYIGYFYDGQDFSKNTGWEIGFNNDLNPDGNYQNYQSTKSNLFYYAKDSYLPKTNIYPGAPDEDWKDTTIYNDVLYKFKCPDYMYVDLASKNELCFANQTGKCEQLSTILITDFSLPMKVTYRFSDQIDSINKSLYGQKSFGENSNYRADDKVKFLFNFDTNLTYDASISGEENVKNNCKHFSEKINVDGGQTYINKLLKADYVQNYINELDQGYQDAILRSPSGVKNPEIFNYEMQKKLLVYDNKKYRNENFEKVDKLLEDNIINSLKYATTVCDSTEYKINVDEEGSREVIDGKYSVYIFEDPEITFDEEFHCSDVFTEEMVDIIKTAYFIIEMAGLAILIVFSALDYIKVFMGDKDDELKKANSNLIKRLIILVILFLLPAIVNILLGLFNVDYVEGLDKKYHLCVHVSNK